MDDAEKARLVWKATRIPGAPPLDDAKAAALGDDLSWAATRIEVYQKVTSKKLKTDGIACLEEIERTARGLSQLLKKNDSAAYRLECFYPDPFQPLPRRPTGPRKGGESVRFLPNLCEMQDGLESLGNAADEALATLRRGGGGISTPRMNTPMEYCVFELAGIFKKYGGEDPGTSTVKEKKGGPFVRFVHEAARQFSFNPPAGETIAAALRKRKAIPN